MAENSSQVTQQKTGSDHDPDKRADTDKENQIADPNAHLVLVVHGIGEQVAGKTVDEVVASVLSEHENRPDADWSENGVDIKSVHVPLTEQNFKDAPGVRIPKTFECYTSTVEPKDTQKHKCVLCEVHWSDLSPAPKGAIATIFDLVQLVLGLGYIAMDNVENVRANILFRAITHGYMWIFYAAIAVVNAMMLIGIGLLALATYFPGIGYLYIMFANAVAGFVLWCFLRFRKKETRRFLVRVFRRGTFLWSVTTLACLGFLAAFPHEFNRVFSNVWGFLAPWGLADRTTACGSYVSDAYRASLTPDMRPAFDFDSVSCFVEMNLAVVGILWVLATASAIVLLLGYVRKDHNTIIYPAICAAMLLFWSIVASGFWLAIRQIFDQLDPTRDDCAPSTLGQVGSTLDIPIEKSGFEPIYALFCDHLDKVLGTLTAAVVCLAVLVTAGWILQSNRKRVILHGLLRFILAIFIIGLPYVLIGLDLGDPNGFWARLTSAVVAAVLALAILVYNFNEAVARVLGVARDVIVYLRRDKCLWLVKPEDRAGNYPYRDQIDARFDRVLDVMSRTVRPHRVTIISHSQGTVIAARALQRLTPDPSYAKNMLFITMGSPIWHLYAQYFPQNYPVSTFAHIPDLKWHNIYRPDDFVGKDIVFPDGVDGHNHRVGKGGHSHYFSDIEVWQVFWGKTGFRMFTNPES